MKHLATSYFGRAVDWVRAHRTRSIVVVGISLICAAGSIAYLWYSAPIKKPYIAPLNIKKPEKLFYSPLTGKRVADEVTTKQLVTAIMIENSPDARPQSGIKSAGIVYEAVAEGGITRFLTLFQEDKPQLIGPVRSLRMYYLDWAAGYDASIAHIGGSAAALAEVRNGSYKDIDQFFNARAYWRATDRAAPHNVYTSFERLDALNQAKGYTTSSFVGFARTDEKPPATPSATDITINISGPIYNTHYTYDAKSNTYARSVGGKPHNDREAGQITPSSVIAMKVNMVRVFEDGYRESITTTGSGEAVVFQNGTATNVTWKKDGRTSPLQLLNTDGTPYKLVRGQTWVTAVPGQGSIAWQ